MKISEKDDNVIELADYRRKPVRYDLYTEPEFPQPGEPGFFGTYTPPAPYHVKKRDDADVEDR